MHPARLRVNRFTGQPAERLDWAVRDADDLARHEEEVDEPAPPGLTVLAP